MLAWDVCPGEETIAAFVAGQLPHGERDGVDSHLDTCTSCQELVASLAKLQPARDTAPDPADSELAGTLGRYVLHARLGAGGMGVVYAAYDPELDRRVALKVLRRTRAGELLREEARAIAKLAHPNVIAVHDVGEADGEVFVAMEHVDGVTVREWLREPRKPSEILDVFVQAGRGLAAAHRAGLIHRDVKPSNIIVGNDGRARVLDFGLARGELGGELEVAGTPAYMAPEQQRGERIDARADQYAFSVALWEALGGKRDADKLEGVGERVVRALRRGRSVDPADRFPTLEPLLDELAPPPPRRRSWIVYPVLGVVVVVATAALISRRDSQEPCASAGDRADKLWSAQRRTSVRSAFAATKLPYADKAATAMIERLDGWALEWTQQAVASCKATEVEHVQPAQTMAVRTACLDELADRLAAIVALASTADAQVVANADSLVRSLPMPARCAQVDVLSAMQPAADADLPKIQAMRREIAEYDAALLAGRANQIRDRVLDVARRAEAMNYAPLRAHGKLLLARLEGAQAHYDEAIAGYHAAARDATAARDLPLLAEIWIELSQTLGNDVRKLDEAEVFDGYATSLIPQLSNRETFELDLDFARCNRNVTTVDAAKIGAYCQAAIDKAGRMSPPKRAIAIAARTRLGHFLRMQGKQAESTAMLRSVVSEAVEFHGAQHPDVAVARYVLGISLIDENKLDEALGEMRTALEVRRAAYAGNSLQVAESLIGVGDALSSAGKHAEAVTYFGEALAMFSALQQANIGQAANAHVYLGMSLEQLDRAAEALPHYIQAADIADRHLQHREPLAAMALRLAANTQRDNPPDGVPHLERAIRLLERGKATPADLGQTQFRLAEFLAEIPSERARARAMAEAARASFVAVNATAQIAEVDAFLREHRAARK
jgi:eukaryotic-like serine/threonine-protein kinase